MTAILTWSPSQFAVGDFDSTKRYVRSGSGGYALACGRTITMQYVTNSGGVGTVWHFAITGYMEASFTRVYLTDYDSGTPSPIVQGVKI